ncbi:MAG: hypothetical protein V1743_00230 [Nanoarchaeota archaeon]
MDTIDVNIGKYYTGKSKGPFSILGRIILYTALSGACLFGISAGYTKVTGHKLRIEMVKVVEKSKHELENKLEAMVKEEVDEQTQGMLTQDPNNPYLTRSDVEQEVQDSARSLEGKIDDIKRHVLDSQALEPRQLYSASPYMDQEGEGWRLPNPGQEYPRASSKQNSYFKNSTQAFPVTVDSANPKDKVTAWTRQWATDLSSTNYAGMITRYRKGARVLFNEDRIPAASYVWNLSSWAGTDRILECSFQETAGSRRQYRSPNGDVVTSQIYEYSLLKDTPQGKESIDGTMLLVFDNQGKIVNQWDDAY